MTERIELEDSSGTLLLENGTDNYRIDFPIINVNEDVGVTESSNKLIIIIKNVASTVGLTDAFNKFAGAVKNLTDPIVSVEEILNKKTREFAYTLEETNDAYLLEDGSGIYLQDYPLKVASSTVGVTESSQKVTGLLQIIASTVGLVEVSQKIEGFVKTTTDALVSLEEALAKKVSDLNHYVLESSLGAYLLEDSSGYYAIDNLVIVKNAVSTLGLNDAFVRINGTVHNFAETVGLTESFNRLRDIVRTFDETVGLTEGIVRARDIVRNIIINIDILNPTESVNRAMVMFRNTTVDTVGITEVKQRLRSIVKTFSDTIGLTDSLNIITGIIKEAVDVVGLSELSDRIRTVFISHFIGIFTSTDAVDVETFTSTDSSNIGDMIAIDSYNLGDFKIIDDN